MNVPYFRPPQTNCNQTLPPVFKSNGTHPDCKTHLPMVLVRLFPSTKNNMSLTSNIKNFRYLKWRVRKNHIYITGYFGGGFSFIHQPWAAPHSVYVMRLVQHWPLQRVPGCSPGKPTWEHNRSGSRNYGWSTWWWPVHIASIGFGGPAYRFPYFSTNI